MRTAHVIWILLLALLATACGSAAQPEAQQVPAAGASATEIEAGANLGAPYALDGLLALRAFDKDREVVPDSDQSYEFLVVNNSGGELPVVMVLEHVDGTPFRTSLCVEKQCLLGDGDEPSVTDPVMLPPFLELPFQAHVFVGADAAQGQSGTLVLRVEPQVDGIERRELTFSAIVVAP